MVEDDADVRVPVAIALRRAGFDVYEAINAHEALVMLRSSLLFDVVITDVQMPGEMDGIALAETVRTLYPAIRVVVTSASDGGDRVIRSDICFFRKPYLVSQIVEHLRVCNVT